MSPDLHPSSKKNKDMVQQQDDPNLVCFYSPINVNGNGNIVNTNIKIY
jgi:hypothetical protein